MSVTVTLVGRLARDPEQRQSNNGNSYLQVSVAGNEGYGNSQETFFFSARFFGKRADTVASYRKGDLVRLDGHLHEYTSQNGKVYKELQYADIELLQRKNNQFNGGYNAPQNNQQGGYPQGNQFNQPQRQPQQAPQQAPQPQQFSNTSSEPQQAQTAPQGNQMGNYPNQGKNAPQGFSKPGQGYSQEDMPF
ncbi:single-stranded DNA-binding protein [Limosilactobacillus fermentum]|uniref:single-stranded DNA-binding protein n=1 Tax=Limosilactobacillus fermentum TaxID=1613 RepID=UPI0031CD7BBB